MDNNYWDKIPLWNSDSPRFEVTADSISGRIPVARLDRWQDFPDLLESSFFNQNGVQFIFRGHRRFDWSLLPTLGRLTENGIVSDDLANQQLELFRLAVRGRLKDTSLLVEDEQNDELWSVGQHHGLMTPLLDWTYSPYVALFFAFAKEDQQGEEDNPYRALYAINKTFVADDDFYPDIRVLEPRKDDHGRLVNQAGLFTFSPSDATIENKLIETISDFDEFKDATEDSEAGVLARYICKIYIRNEDREGCLKSLRRMNVHHASLFPDLIGASDYCNLLMEEGHRQQAIENETLQIQIAESVSVSDQLTVEVHRPEMKQPEKLNETERLAVILKAPKESTQVEPGRIRLIAKQLVKEFDKHKVVDWQSRDAIQAKLRNLARVILRKNGYPGVIRDQVVERVLAAVIHKEDRKKEAE